MTANNPKSGKRIINMQDVEQWEKTCPVCGEITPYHSIDGGLTSVFEGDCGHKWEVSPFGKKVR